MLKFSHSLTKNSQPMPIYHLQNTFFHQHSGQANTYTIPVFGDPPSDLKSWWLISPYWGLNLVEIGHITVKNETDVYNSIECNSPGFIILFLVIEV